MPTYQEQFDADMVAARATWGYDGDGSKRAQTRVGATWARTKLAEWMAKAEHEISLRGGGFVEGTGLNYSQGIWYEKVRDAVSEARNRIPIAIAAAEFLGQETLISTNPFTSSLGPLAYALDGYAGALPAGGVEYESPYWTAFKSIPQAIADSAEEIGNSIPKISLLIGLAVVGVVAWKVFK